MHWLKVSQIYPMGHALFREHLISITVQFNLICDDFVSIHAGGMVVADNGRNFYNIVTVHQTAVAFFEPVQPAL